MQSVSEFEYSQSDILGHGAFALVFKGRQKKSHRLVAIKQIALKAVPGKLSNIRQKEITILKDLRDVNIVQLYDYVETASDIFLVMEYCNGGDLGDYLIAKKTLSENSIRHLARHIAGALRVLQRLHIIHRDIKPQNLLLSYPVAGGNGGSTGARKDRPFQEATIKLADFGFARYLEGTDMAATLCGSPLYMAPEILLGRRYDSKADLWSVGTILFQCLTGNAPFLASNPHALRKRYEKEKLAPKIPAGSSQYLADLLLQLLRKQPTERMSYDEFFCHDFLKDPSSLPSEVVFGSHPPPPHTKSSPVPIKRHNAKGCSPHTSPHLSASPHHGSSIDYCSLSPSSASGPPLSHRVGSQGSLPYYSAHSSSSDVTDQGFILVDLPGSSSSTTGSRRCSLPTGSADHHSATAASPGSCSSTGHGHTHTPSSSGSLTRYASLTTPFYKVPLPRQPIAAVQPGFVPSGGTTPTNLNMESPHALISHNIPALGSNPQAQGYYFSPSSRRRSDNSLQLMARSPPLPFGKLIHNPYHYQAPLPPGSSSLSSSPHSQSGSSLNLYRHSPLSTPPSANLPSPSSGVGVAIGMVSPGRSSSGHGMKYSLTPHGSGTKLSSLAEETERKTDKRSGSRSSSAAKGRTPPIKVENKPSPSITGDFITHSCLLNSDDDNEIDNEGAEDEDNFPLSLSLTSSVDSTSEQISMATGMAIRTDPFHGNTRYKVRSPEYIEARYKVRTPERIEARPMSAQEAKHGGTSKGEKKLQRAASFSQQRSHQLTNDLADIRQRAFSLSAHGDPLDPNFTAATLITGAGPDLEVSPSSGIVAFKLPFVFSSPNSGSQDLASPSFPGGRDSPKFLSGSPLRPGGEGPAWWEVEQWAESSSSSSCLLALGRSYVLGRELLSMAKARQGPIMLLSTELSDSGVASRLQRCLEQLVLVAKAISILESGLRQYQIEQATADIGTLEETNSLHAKNVEAEVQKLLEVCLGEARRVREQQRHYITTKGHQPSLVSAEKLLCLEALDMCKSAVLNEQCGRETKECVKRYRRARMIFQFLLTEAHTQNDKTILNKYMQSIDSRIQQLELLVSI